MKRPKKTFRRYCVVKGYKIDFGLGPGVIARDEVTFTDAYNQGFDTDSFRYAQRERAVEMILSHVTVLAEESSRWNPDIQATQAALKKSQSKLK